MGWLGLVCQETCLPKVLLDYCLTPGPVGTAGQGSQGCHQGLGLHYRKEMTNFRGGQNQEPWPDLLWLAY